MSLLVTWVVALAFVAIVSVAIVGYGLVASVLLDRPRSALILGVGFYATAILATGIWSGYNMQVQTLLCGFGWAGLWTYRRRWRQLLSTSEIAPKFRGLDAWWLVLPAIYCLTRFFACGLPQQHSDPLYYHLAAPKLWNELGRVRLTPEHPSFAQAGLWEGLYGLPMIWLGSKGFDLHVITQLFAQWMHFFWGQVGSLLAAAALLRRLAPPLKTRPGLAVFAGWLCVVPPAFEWLGCLAKNDYIMLLFALGAALEALEGRWLVAGVLAGLAYSTKVLAVWSVIAMLALVPWRKWPWFFAGAAGGAAAFFFRNFYFTRNPFFPMLDDKFGPGWLSSGFVSHNLSYGGAPRLDAAMLPWISSQLFQGALPKAIVLGGVVALALEAWRRRGGSRREGAFFWIVFVVIQLGFALLMLRPAADGRYAGLAAIFAAIVAMGAVIRESSRIKPLWAFGTLVAIPLGLLVNSPLDELWKIPRDYWFQPATLYVERFHPVFDMQQWVEKNVAPGDKIVFLAEKQQFYLDRPFEAVVEMKKWENILTPLHSPRELFATLRRLGYRYVHFSPQTGGFPIQIRPYWPQLEALAPRAAFRSSTSLIFDLSKM